MDRKNSYGRKPLEEMIREYAHAVDNGDWPDSRLSKKVIVNEVYARIKNTFDMLDEAPEDADQIYEMLIAPMGREDRQLKEEIQEGTESDSLRGIYEILLAAREKDLPLSLDCTVGTRRIMISRTPKEEDTYSEMGQKMSMAGSGIDYRVSKEKIKEAIEKYGLPRKCQVDAPSSGEEETGGDTLERLLVLGQQSEAELYRLAADELEGKSICPEAVKAVYIYEVNQLPRGVHSARENIRVRFKACLKLSMLLLEDGYERAAADNIGKFIDVIRLVPGMGGGKG